jgi:cytochrome c oxidase accessory protein FixG
MEQTESFRDHIPYEDEHGKRKWIYPKKPSGRFHRYRIIVSSILLTILFVTPFIKINGHPFFLLNVFERKFVILGNVFWPQDTHLLILLLLTFFVFVILFTAIFGRVWCGWACPQTLFMEMVFRKIEYLIEGDANQQRKLSKQPWNFEKIWKRSLKHFLFIVIAILIGHTVMAYLIGIDKTIEIVSQPPSKHLAGFIGLAVFSTIFYLVFSIVREHACTFICPYGRLQSVLINRETMVVAYDHVRGEPRGKLTKNTTEQPKGDCVDCGLCVQVCPTGIDIRNGTQMECVNCTACIDACDEVMDKIKKPRGLIRIDSLNGIVDGVKKKKLNVRTIAYSIVLLLLVGVFFVLVFTRTDIEATVVRASGQLYQELPDDKVSNLYNIQVVNKTFDTKELSFRLKNIEGEIKMVGGKNQFSLASQDMLQEVMIIEIPKSQIKSLKNKLIIEVVSEGKVLERVKTTFLGPQAL